MRFRALAAGSLLALLAGCGVPSKRGVALILLDTTRADRLSCYGFPFQTSPHIDQLASEGLRCLRAWTTAPATLPATASLLTGRWPRYHGARYNSGYTLSPEAPSLASMLGQAGWETGAFVSAAVLRSSTGLSQGFRIYDDQMTKNAQAGLHFAERPGTETVAKAMAFLESQNAGKKSFFIFVHLYEPHFPYEPPPAQAAAAPDPYSGEILAADAALAPLLARLRSLQPRPLIIFAADHGEGLGEHGEETHGFFLYEGTLRVPLIFWGAEIKPEILVEPVSLVDVVPTVLSLLGLQPPPGLDGQDLQRADLAPRVLAAEALAPEAEFFWSRSYAAWDGNKKLILSPGARFFSLDEDPAEARPGSADSSDESQRRLRGGLRQIYSRPEPGPGPAAEDEARLRSLGYLGGGERGNEGDFVVREDPAEEVRARVIRETVWLRMAVLRGSPGEAAKALSQARTWLARFPDSPALKELVQLGEERARGGGN